MKRYYVEITDSKSGERMMQSKWFGRFSTAEKWIDENLDYVLPKLNIDIMSIDCRQGEYIKILEKTITC